MAPKVSVDAKLEELHDFVSANVVSLAARTGDSLLRCFRQNASPTEKYWCTFLGRKMESFNDAQHGRLVDMYNLISRHRLRERPGGNDIEHLGEEVGSEPHHLAEQDEHRLAKRMKKHATFAMEHKGRMRTTLFLHGQKGSGKTLFVEWLASELGLPIYYIDLQAPFLNDSVLRDALTPRKLKHDLPVIFHFDEFQSMIEAWTNNARAESGPIDHSLLSQSTRVTIQGLQSVLEGISTPSNALFIFTGSQDLPMLKSMSCGAMRHEWEGLLRRFPVREMIPPIGRDDVTKVVSHFFRQFVPEGAIEKVHIDHLEQAWDLAVERDIPFDMASKYCQERLRDAFIEDLVIIRQGLHVPLEDVKSFVDFVFDKESLTTWRERYAGGKLQRH